MHARSSVLIYFFFILSLFTSAISAGDYFQQKVSYKIQAELIPSAKKILLNSSMLYTNNSPDTLREIFVRLHWNIFRRGSYGRRLYSSNRLINTPLTEGVELKEVKLKGENVTESCEIDNTIVRIPLKDAMKPGESVSIDFSAGEQVPVSSLRMGYRGRDFSIAHWFPAVCVYDKNGWQTDQYLGQGEFNEEIADYEVDITLPASYLVFYTGYLINPEEVLPEEAQKNLAQAKSSDKLTRIYDQSINPAAISDSLKKTWSLKAENVRTFAFAAFEKHVWDAQNLNGIMINTVYTKGNEDYYSGEGMKASVHAVKFFSEKFGPYPYPNVFAVASPGIGGGMEYPGITFINASSGGGIEAKITSMVLIHEIGHNWCPMIINSNETRYAFQDEGFTDYWTLRAIEEMYGKENNLTNFRGLLDKLIPSYDIGTYYYAEVVRNELGRSPEPVLTHSDKYKSSYNYQVNSYQKTAMILSMLEYVIGSNAFKELFREYFLRYKFKHVRPEDFFRLASEMHQKYNGKRNLEWFFDQWLSKTAVLDYALKDLNYEFKEGKYKTSVTIESLKEAVMPAEVEVRLGDGTKACAKFEAEDFLKGPSVVTKTFEFDAKPLKAEIDPSHRLLDINRLNNSTGIIPDIKFRFNPVIELAKFPRPFEYSVFWFPALGFNNIDGFNLGLNLLGTYMGDRKNFDMTITQGMKFGKNSLGGYITFKDNLEFWGPSAEAAVSFHNYEGRRGASISVSKSFQSLNWAPAGGLTITAKYFDAFDNRYFNPASYDILPSVKSPDYIYQRKYFWVNTRLTYYNTYSWMDLNSSLNLESGFSVQGTQRKNPYQKITFSLIERIFLPLLREIKLRQYLGYSPGNLPSAKGYYLTTVNPIEEYSSFIYRSPGIISNEARMKRSVPFGGGFMRGYYNRNLYGNIITSFNSEVSLKFITEKIPVLGAVLNAFSPAFFADAGNIWSSGTHIKLNEFMADYGFSLRLPVRMNVTSFSNSDTFSFLEKLGINQIRFDFPVYVTHPIAGEDKLKFRWLFSFQAPM